MPRRHRDITFTLALCLSLVVHALIVEAAIRHYAEFAGFLSASSTPAPTLIIDPRPVTPPPIDPAERLGDSDGARDTDSLASTPGDRPMQAPQADQTQASLSLDPAGENGETAPSAAAPPPSPRVFEAPAENQAVQLPRVEPAGRPELPVIGLEGPAPVGAQEEQEPRESENSSTETPPAVVAQATPQVSTSAPPQAQSNAPGDPAPQADTESDAFSTTAAVDFIGGKTVARFGRKHKITRPRLEMAGHADMLSLRPPVRIDLRLYINVEGYVEKAEIIKSSGSINIDQPTRIAAYQWWFEPRKDATGKARPEVMTFTVGFL